MNSMGVGAVFAVLLLFTATVKAAPEVGVTFDRGNFTMTCPQEGNWFKAGETHPEKQTQYTLAYDDKTKGLYHCEYQRENRNMKYYFYVKGKMCANCLKLDAIVFMVAVVVDVVGTVLVMIIIYRCTKKKSLGPASKAPARSGGRAPPVPSPDYEALNPHTRTQDPYSFVNRMG